MEIYNTGKEKTRSILILTIAVRERKLKLEKKMKDTSFIVLFIHLWKKFQILGCALSPNEMFLACVSSRTYDVGYYCCDNNGISENIGENLRVNKSFYRNLRFPCKSFIWLSDHLSTFSFTSNTTGIYW